MKNALEKLALLTLMAFAAMVPAASAAGAQLSGSVSRIGSTTPAAYAVTITNSGDTTEGSVLLEFPGAEPPAASGLAPSTCTFNQPVAGAIGCPAIHAGETLKLCYVGPAVDHVAVFFGSGERFALSAGGAVSSCPVPGFVLPTGGGGGGSGGDTPAGKPLTIAKATVHPNQGTATLKLKVSGPGTVKLSGTGVKGATARAKAAGTISLTVKAKGSAAAKLKEKGRVTLHVSLTFTPSGGSATTLKKNLTLTRSTR